MAFDTFTVGATELGQTVKGGESFGFDFEFDISQHTDPKSIVTFEVYASTDGGVTFEFAGSCSRPGGIVVDEIPNSPTFGQELKTASFGVTHNISNKINGVDFSNAPKWIDPIFKTVVKVEGKAFSGKLNSLTSKPRTSQSEAIHHSIAVVQSVAAYGNAGVSSVTTGNITTTPGNLLIANLSNYNATATFLSITDSTDGTNYNKNTWTNSVAALIVSNNATRQYYVENCNGGSTHTFRHTGNAVSYYPGIVVNEVSGYATTPLDNQATDTDTTGTSHTTGATATISQANELLIAFGSGGTTYAEAYTGEVGFTTQNNQVNTPGATVGGICQSKVVSSAAGYSWTYTTSSNAAVSHYITTWKAAGVARPIIPFSETQFFSRNFSVSRHFSSLNLLQNTLAQAAGATPFSTFSGFAPTVSRKFSPSGVFTDNLMQTTLAPTTITYTLHPQCVF